MKTANHVTNALDQAQDLVSRWEQFTGLNHVFDVTEEPIWGWKALERLGFVVTAESINQHGHTDEVRILATWIGA